MKKLIVTLALAAPLAHADPADNYLNFILQIQNNASQTTHKIDDIDPRGSRKALEGVQGSAVFQLWTIHRETGAEYLLDEKTVSSYHPEATISISSDDPYRVVPRTRIDQPFTVTYTVSGLKPSDPNAHAAAKAVVLNHQVTTFEKGEFSETAQAATKISQRELNRNATTVENHPTSVTSDDLPSTAGVEEITIYAKPDYGAEDPTMLARQKVHVWPLARGVITGIIEGETYANLPNISVELRDLYPDSETYLRIYKGNPTRTPSDPIIVNTSNIKISDVIPQSRTFLVTTLNDFLEDDGTYTIEIAHVTPFESAEAPAQLSPVTFHLKRALKINGQLNSSE